jgi:DNA-binding Lrp family transcriptional regulator
LERIVRRGPVLAEEIIQGGAEIMRSYERRYHEGTLDNKDIQILQAAIGDPQASVERIASIVEMPASTVGKRLSYLLRNQYIERTIRIVDWAAVGYPLRFRIDIKFNIRDFKASLPDGVRRTLNAKANSLKQLALHILRFSWQGIS